MKTTQIKQDKDNNKEEEVDLFLSLIVSSTNCSKRYCELILMFFVTYPLVFFYIFKCKYVNHVPKLNGDVSGLLSMIRSVIFSSMLVSVQTDMN